MQSLRRFWFLPVAFAMAYTAWTIAALFGDDKVIENIYNQRLYQVLVERQATGIEDLTERFLRDQESFLWIAPPHPDLIEYVWARSIEAVRLAGE